MEIEFKNTKTAKLFNSDKELKKNFGAICARKIRSRLDDLSSVTCLEEMRPPVPGRCHELLGDRKGQLTLDVQQPYRLVFEPCNPDVKLRKDGGLDWSTVTKIRIIGVEDTHE